MTPASLAPTIAGPGRLKLRTAAEDMQNAVEDRAARTGVPVPPYEFLEMIGKGSFGQVFKCRKRDTNELFAVKIIDVDTSDYRSDPSLRDEAINDFVREIAVLQQLKDARARNINVFYEALPLHSQLWLVSDYCGGGSVHTLMKALPQGFGLEEMFIIPITREVGIALRHVHEAGIIHRDLKCSNIFITEDGRVQVGDFGVSGVMEDKNNKRTTIIGTPNWMPPEMFSATPGFCYGTEVDCWAFGCTVYEMATGRPPMVPAVVTKLMEDLCKRDRVEGGPHSDLIRDFLAFCLRERPEDRPSADQILGHPFLVGTARTFPTTSLIRLLERYVIWEEQGGQRQSLLNPMLGASGPEKLPEGDSEEWNFSAGDRLSQMFHFNSWDSGDADDGTLKPNNRPRPPSKYMTPFQKAGKEAAVQRGERSMLRVFDPEAAPYEYNDSSLPMSDLPFRNMSGDVAGDRTTMIDLDAADIDLGQAPNIDLTLRSHKPNRFFLDDDDDGDDDELAQDDDDDNDDDEGTYHPSRSPKRATRDWKFPSTAPAGGMGRNRRTMEWTFQDAQNNIYEHDETPMMPPRLEPAMYGPTDSFEDSTFMDDGSDLMTQSAPESPRQSMIDLDFADVAKRIIRPSTSSSAATQPAADDQSTADPFELEDHVQAPSSESAADSFRDSKRASHRPTQSAPIQILPPHSRTDESWTVGPPLFEAGDGSVFKRQSRSEVRARALLNRTADRLSLNHDLATGLMERPKSFQGGRAADFDRPAASPPFPSADPKLARPLVFPTFRAPSAETLNNNADPALLRSELKTQIKTFAFALEVSRAALMSYRFD